MSSPEAGVGADLSRIQDIAETMPAHELAQWAKIRRGEPEVIAVLVGVCLQNLQAINCGNYGTHQELEDFADTLEKLTS